MLHQRQPLEIVVRFRRLFQKLVRLAFENSQDAVLLLGPLYHLVSDNPYAAVPSLHEGYATELRTLRGSDGRIVATNQQTFTVIK